MRVRLSGEASGILRRCQFWMFSSKVRRRAKHADQNDCQENLDRAEGELRGALDDREALTGENESAEGHDDDQQTEARFLVHVRRFYAYQTMTVASADALQTIATISSRTAGGRHFQNPPTARPSSGRTGRK